MNKTLTKIVLAALPSLYVLIGLAFPAWAASEEKISREFDVQPGGRLIIDVGFGNVDVNAGAADKVTIEASRTIDFRDDAAEKDYLVAAPLMISAEGNTVTVRARCSGEECRPHSRHTRMDARYTIHVPKTFAADLNTGGGSVWATDLASGVRANTGGGDLKFSRVKGELFARSGGGSIDVNGCDGAADIQTGGGDITLANGQGALQGKSGGGAISVRDFMGDTHVSTGGGELTLERIDGAITGGTSGGGITASVTGGAVKAISLKSSGGSIQLALPKTAAADISADTSAGNITTDLPIEATRSDSEHLRGKLNGGGPAVVLSTSSGDISINAARPTTAAR